MVKVSLWITACTKSPGWSLQAGSNRGAYGTHWCSALSLSTLLVGSLGCSEGHVLCLSYLFWQPQPCRVLHLFHYLPR